MAETVTLVNQITSPVVYTDDARVIGAGERLEGVTLDRTGQRAVNRGDLVVIESRQAEKRSTRKREESPAATTDGDAEDSGAPGKK